MRKIVALISSLLPANQIKEVPTGARFHTCSRFFSRTSATLALVALSLCGGACSLTATRPVQLMSDTAASLRAAKEVQAETLAPELYRQATEWFAKAKHEYKFKNFKMAVHYARKARNFAEQAEFQAIRNGGKHSDTPPPPDMANSPEPYAYPTPEGTPASEYEKRAQEEEQQRAPSQPPSGSGPPADLGKLPTP